MTSNGPCCAARALMAVASSQASGSTDKADSAGRAAAFLTALDRSRGVTEGRSVSSTRRNMPLAAAEMPTIPVPDPRSRQTGS
eukprot:scaffold31893_cov129-Isochrysis_galbana.AAC.5